MIVNVCTKGTASSLPVVTQAHMSKVDALSLLESGGIITQVSTARTVIPQL